MTEQTTNMGNEEILEGFTSCANGIPSSSWEGFGWFGQLQVELDGEMRVISAGGHASGDDGDMCFKIFTKGITQEQANRMNVIAYKTDNPAKE